MWMFFSDTVLSSGFSTTSAPGICTGQPALGAQEQPHGSGGILSLQGLGLHKIREIPSTFELLLLNSISGVSEGSLC